MKLAGLAIAGWRRLLRLDEPLPTLGEAEFEALIERQYPWNFTVNLLEGVAYWIGMSFLSSATIAPLFVSKLTLNPLLKGAVIVSGILIVMEFTVDVERTTYFGIVNTAIGIGFVIMPLLGAGLAGIGYGWTFGVSGAAALLAWVAFRWYVHEPRWQPTNDRSRD
jgi:MFS family permease